MRRFTGSMRQRIDLAALYADALYQLRAGDRGRAVRRPWPDANPFTLDQLLNEDVWALARCLPPATPRS